VSDYEINVYDDDLIKDVDEYLKELHSERGAIGRKIKVTGTINQDIKNDEFRNAIKIVRREIAKMKG
jgi:DNA replication initiation complex subunit (GINS family)